MHSSIDHRAVVWWLPAEHQQRLGGPTSEWRHLLNIVTKSAPVGRRFGLNRRRHPLVDRQSEEEVVAIVVDLIQAELRQSLGTIAP